MNDRTPGVVFNIRDGKKFYVDVLWAISIGSKDELDKILHLDSESISHRLRELSLTPVMRKSYTIAGYLIKRSTKNSQEDKGSLSKKIIDWYYHKLSLTLVPWQLSHPIINRYLRKITEFLLDLIIVILRLDLLNDEEVFLTKNELIRFKGIHYEGQSNSEIKTFLKKYNSK